MICRINQWFQLGKSMEYIDQTTEFVELTLLKGDEDMEQLADITLNGKNAASHKYQSVHWGVEITIKNVPLERIEDCGNDIQAMVFERLSSMDDEGQTMLDNLVEARQ